jgi:ferredoxin
MRSFLLVVVGFLVLAIVTRTAVALSLSSSSSNTGKASFFGPTTKNVATQILQGTGEAVVDMNQYNLESLEQIQQEWKCQLVQKAGETKPQVELAAKSNRELFVDTIQVQFPRLANTSSLGLELMEWAGGREDGLGITVISKVIPGGAASSCSSILPGDSLAQVSLIQKSRQGLQDSQQEFIVKTLCLSYDATVAALQSLPTTLENNNSNSNNNNSQEEEYYYALTLKRLRRKPKVKVHLQYPDQKDDTVTLELFAGENLRHGMLTRGIKLNDPLAKRFDGKTIGSGNCGAGGLCRTCSVVVLQGGQLLNPPRVAEQQIMVNNPRWRLACKAIVGYGMQQGDITLRVNPQQW